MNGIHDMGGMHGMGPVEAEKDEPVFHEPWEGRTHAMNRALGAWRKWNIDTGRFGIEQLPPEEYLRMSYYEKWFARKLALLVQTGLISKTEAETGRPDADAAVVKPALLPDQVAALGVDRGIPSSVDPAIPPRFVVGQRVRTKNIHPTTHTRLPRYARDKAGVIHLDHGVHNFPDTNAHGLGPKRQHCYAVRFTARELWGSDANDFVHLDLWDDYLEPV
jgi:nitrile hydratase